MRVAATLPEIPGYRLLGEIGSGGSSVVYRAQRGQTDVALKVLHGQTGSTILFRKEIAALARLDHPSIAQVVEGGECDAGCYVVTELIDGDDLARTLRGRRLEPQEVVALARDLAGALAEVHRAGLVHRDVKPGNILMRGHRPVLIDFGLAVGVADANEQSKAVVGTFVYGAPEQTGVLDRPMDARADLYALGCVLFECALGHPPFEAESAHELVAAHATVVPPSLHAERPEIRPSFARIVAKLLCKDPDDRYQSARGLLWDLEHLAELDRADVPLGKEDSRFALVPEAPLVGREAELEALGRAWDEARAGSGRLVQIEGEPGAGKTRLIGELLSRNKDAQTLLLSGKADKIARSPFGPLRAAVDESIRRLERLPPRAREQELDRVRAATQVPGILRRLSRDLSRVLGDVPEIHPLDGDAEQERFYEKVADFFVGLAKQFGSAILLVDDVQWLDDGTLRVLAKLASRLAGVPLLLATTARSDAASQAAAEEFWRTMKAAPRSRIEVPPLDEAGVAGLLSSHLGGKPLNPDVSRSLGVRAKGNPFALLQYLHALFDQGLLEPTATGWNADRARLDELILSSGVVELLIGRMAAIGGTARSVMSHAAVLGFTFDKRILARMAERGAADVDGAIASVLRSNLIEQLGPDTYCFVHDRVQESLLQELDDRASGDINQRAAEALEAHYGEEPPDAVLFSLARHWSDGHAAKHPGKVYRWNRAAGLCALEQYSNEEARALLSRAMASARDLGWQGGPELAHLQENLGLACSRTGRLVEAREHFEAVLAAAGTERDRARLQYHISLVYSSEGNNEVAWERGLSALELGGVRIPASRALCMVAIAWFWILTSLKMRTGWRFGSVPDAKRDEELAICRMLSANWLTIYYLGDYVRALLFSLLRVNRSHDIGMTPEYPKSLAAHTAQLANVFGHYALPYIERVGDRAVKMAEQLGDPEAIAYSKHCAGIALDYSGKTVIGQERVWAAIPEVEKYCIARDVGLFIGANGISPSHRGRTREAVEKMETWLPTQRRMETHHYIANVLGCLYTQFVLLGRAREGLGFLSEHRRLAEQMSTIRFVQSNFHAHMICALYEQNDLGAEFEESVARFLELNFDHPLNRLGHVVHCYARLDQLMRTQGERERGAAKARVLEALRIACYGPPLRCILNPVHRCHMYVIRAAIAREEGRHRRALRLLAKAEDDATSSDSVWGLWAIHRERARLHIVDGRDHEARLEAERGLELAVAEGWVTRADATRWEFASLLAASGQARPDAHPLTTSLGPITYGRGSGYGVRLWSRYRTQMETRLGSKLGHRASMQASPSRQVGRQPLRGQLGSMTGSVLETGTILRETMSSQRYFEALLEVTLAGASSPSPAEQCRRALDACIRVLVAERGLVFLADDAGSLEPVAARDATGNDLPAARGYSSTVVKKSFEENRGLIVTGTEEGEILGSESAVSEGLRSIMAAPIGGGEAPMGVIYVDSKVMGGLFTSEHVDVLRAIGNQIGAALRTAADTRRRIELEAARAALRKDLELASAVQALLIPGDATLLHGKLRVSARYLPSALVGGDWWWMDELGDGRLLVVVADVVGHGAGAAMVTASLAGCYLAARRLQRSMSVHDLLGLMNATLRSIGGSNAWASVSAALIDTNARSIELTSAAAPCILVRRGDGRVEPVPLQGRPLGSDTEATLGTKVRPFDPGDKVLLYSDGLVEREGFGLRKLSRLLSRLDERTGAEAMGFLIDGSNVRIEGGTSAEADDITVVLVELS